MARSRHRRTTRDPSRRGEEGIALIVALIVTVILVAVTLQFTYTTTIDLKLVRNQSRGSQSFFAARGAITLAQAQLEDDLASDGETSADSFHDGWAGSAPLTDDDGNSLEQEDLLGYEGGSFTQNIGETAIEYTIRDEDGKICINNLALETLKIEETEEQPSGEGEEGGQGGTPDPSGGGGTQGSDPGGAGGAGGGQGGSGGGSQGGGKKKKLSPQELAKERVEHTKKVLKSVLAQLGIDEGEAEALVEEMEALAPFRSVRELARFEAIEPEILEGYTDEFGFEYPGLVDLLTVHSRGAINLNTAPREVLVAILEEKYKTDAESFADAILEFRAPTLEVLEEEEEKEKEKEEAPPPPIDPVTGEPMEEEEEEEDEPAGGVFASVGDLAKEIPGLENVFGANEQDEPGRRAGAALKRQLGVKSRFFRVVVVTGDDPHRQEYRFVLRRGKTPGVAMPVLVWEERQLHSEDPEFLGELP